MVIDPESALRFLEGWKALLLQAGGAPRRLEGQVLYARLGAAREAVAADPSLIETAAAALERAGRAVDADVLAAARTLQLAHWVYLRDTTAYSVFIDSRGEAAYAVLGLTDRLRDVIGGSGAIVRTGLACFRGRFVCDGLITNLAWIGPNMRREFNETLARLRKGGAFHAALDPGLGGAAPARPPVPPATPAVRFTYRRRRGDAR